jgi:putative salt-induced outer membrane protein
MSSRTTTTTTLTRTLLLASLAAGSSLAMAEAKVDGLWHGSIVLGGAFASGNSSARTLTGSADASLATAADKISLFGNVNYGRNKVAGVNTTTADQVRAGGRYDYNLSDTTFVFGGVDGETNKAAGLDSRYNLTTGLGYKIIRTDDTTFDVFGGIGYSNAKFTVGDRIELTHRDHAILTHS